MTCSWIAGLRERGCDLVKVAAELENHANPPGGAAAPEQPFPAGYRIRFAMSWAFHCVHDISQCLFDLRVTGSNMNPPRPGNFNIAPIWASDKKYHTR